MAKAQIKELFFRDKAMQLPLPGLGGGRLQISESVLRKLITALASLFLLALAVALVTQLFENRNGYFEISGRERASTADLVAKSIELKLLQDAASGVAVRPASAELLLEVLTPEILSSKRHVFLFGDRFQPIAVMPPEDDVASGDVSSGLLAAAPAAVHRLTMANGDALLVALRPVGAFPLTVAVAQRQADVLHDWWQYVTRIAILFGVTLAVLSLLITAFHWQSGISQQADRLLAAATHRMDKALDGGQCGLLDWNLADGSIFWSSSMFHILGLSPGGGLLSYRDIATRIHPDDSGIESLVEELLTSKRKVFDHEFRMQHASGDWIWLRARAALAQDVALDQKHLVGIVFDITEQKTLDRLNREAEVRLKDAIENISEAFVLWDADSRLVICNSKYQQFHSLPTSVCIPGTHYNAVQAAAKEPLVKQYVSGQPADGSSVQSMEVQLADGRWLQINERRTKDGGFVSVGTDISALKKHEERLLYSERTLMTTVRDLQKERLAADEQSRRLAELADKYAREKARAETANRAKSEFLANMSHELRTPLNAIIGFSEMMNAEMFGPLGVDKYREYIRDVHKSGQFLLDVINDILDMSKIEAGRVDVEIGDVNLRTVIDDSIRLVSPRANEGRITLYVKATRVKPFRADGRALKQVLINLLSNAVKFTPEGGRVTIAAQDAEDQVTITIADTGIGIPAQDIEKLGRPFEQVENQFTKSRGGSGLGLAISRSLVELHGGELSIASVEGKGTTVTVTLPRTPASG